MAAGLQIIVGDGDDLNTFGTSPQEGVQWIENFMSQFSIEYSLRIIWPNNEGFGVTGQGMVPGDVQCFIVMVNSDSMTLPAMVASCASHMIPVYSVAIKSWKSGDLRAPIEIFIQPPGTPVALVGGYGIDGFVNAALLYLQTVAQTNPVVKEELAQYLSTQHAEAAAS